MNESGAVGARSGQEHDRGWPIITTESKRLAIDPYLGRAPNVDRCER